MLSGYKTYILTGLAALLIVVGNGLENITNLDEFVKLLQTGAIAALRAGVGKVALPSSPNGN